MPVSENILTTLQRRLFRSLYIELNRDYRRTVFLAGTGRSGTTWVSEVINHANSFRYIFEPFHPGKSRICRHFLDGQYLRPDDDRDLYLHPAERILTGQIGGGWVNWQNRKHLVRSRLVKEVRGNLYVGWIAAHFPAMPVLYVVRHPCAVAASQRKGFVERGNWAPNLSTFLSQETLMADHLSFVADDIVAAIERGSLLEQIVYRWCIENYVALRQLGSLTNVFFYEHLCDSDSGEFERLFKLIGMSFGATALAQTKVPSRLSRKESAVVTGSDPRRAWSRNVSPEEISSTLKILSKFGLECLYGEGPLPRVEPGDHKLPTSIRMDR